MRTSTTKFLLPAALMALVFFTACETEQAQETETAADAELSDTEMADTAMMGAEAAAQQKINLNTASENEFRTIPNVGDRMIGEFVEYRPYVSIRQFREEIGKYVDEQQVQTYEQYVYVPVDPNESDEATLQQLPGVNEAVASELVAGRPYASNEAFLQALGSHVSQEQVSLAESYLSTE